MKDTIPIPDRLKKFPLYQGMLVHFTVWVGDDGVPDFKVVQENNRRLCMVESLCALCGQTLLSPMVFIGGAGSMESRVFVDGPMHEECASYAVKVCPYLMIETWQHTPRKSRVETGPGVKVFEYEEVPIGRPRMGVFYTTGYSLVRERADGPIYYRANEPIKIDWDAMPQPGAHHG